MITCPWKHTINFDKSHHYNPLAYVHSEKDILKLVNVLIANTKGEGKSGDDFWVKAETLLYTALISYICTQGPNDERNFTTVGDYLMATVNAMRQGLSYSLPTAKAYYWMVGGFVFQLFITYIFAAIFAFGFMGLLLKASKNDDTRWFADAFGGFARPLEITWLLALMNLLTAVPFVVFGLVAWVVALPLRCLGVLGEVLGAAFAAVAVGVGVICTLAVMYGYRQAWFIKNERPDAPAIECLRSSYRMMNGFRWRAFCLDFSFVGWIAFACALLLLAMISAQVALVSGVVAGAVSFVIGLLAFWMAIKVFLGMAVARVVFYRELK